MEKQIDLTRVDDDGYTIYGEDDTEYMNIEDDGNVKADDEDDAKRKQYSYDEMLHIKQKGKPGEYICGICPKCHRKSVIIANLARWKDYYWCIDCHVDNATYSSKLNQ